MIRSFNYNKQYFLEFVPVLSFFMVSRSGGQSRLQVAVGLSVTITMEQITIILAIVEAYLWTY